MKGLRRITCLVLSTFFVVMATPFATAAEDSGIINIDGQVSDWSNIEGIVSSDRYVDEWKCAYDNNFIYLMYTGSATSQWDYNYEGNNYMFTVDGSNKEPQNFFIWGQENSSIVKNEIWSDRSDSVGYLINNAHWNNPGPYYGEIRIDKASVGDSFNISFLGTSIPFEQITNLESVQIETETEPAIYSGITIDGTFNDWDAVEKVAVNCPNPQHPTCLSEAAAVWDGDYFYIYFRDGVGSNASGAGTHSNGKFAIVSDYGYETDIQLTTKPEVKGVDGALVSYVGDRWEIAIPASALPNYENSMSLNFYLGDTIVANIMNLQGNEKKSSFSGIVYDGNYEDWNDYGHQTIEYATAGSQEKNIDAKGALYQDGTILYGHVITDMPQHLQEAGGEFTQAVTINFNSTDPQNSAYSNGSYTFAWRVISVDGNGNIGWNPQKSGYAPGTYEFGLCSTREMPIGNGGNNAAWGTSGNINSLNSNDTVYGKMIMTVGIDGKDEMEFYVDTELLAQAFGCETSDLKIVSAQFGRIGQQWIFTAGTSTAPIIGVGICGASVAGVLLFTMKKKRGSKECIEK